jgi:dTDP-4-amino-4,6-dideoxygalactose transaminase
MELWRLWIWLWEIGYQRDIPEKKLVEIHYTIDDSLYYLFRLMEIRPSLPPAAGHWFVLLRSRPGKLSNICAGIGRGQMAALKRFVSRRQEIHRMYTDLLQHVPGIGVMQNPSDDFDSNYWLTCILINFRQTGKTPEDVRRAMETKHIETRPLWKPMHLQPVFKECPFYGDGTSERLFNSGLCLPSGASLSDDQIHYVASSVISVVSE